MSAAAHQLAPLDEKQRYTIDESARYWRCSRAYVWKLIARGEITTIRDGKRRYIPGTEVVRRCAASKSAA